MFRKIEKPLEEELPLIPDEEFFLEQDEFIGSLYKGNKSLEKVIIVLGGTEGNFNLTKLLAKNFSEQGINALALAYFNESGLPDHFENNPIEYVEKVALKLKAIGYSKIGIWGISKGTELALISASLLPELITTVVAVCPINIIPQGFSLKDGPQTLNTSSWSFRGKEFIWAQLKFSKLKILFDSLKERSISLRSCYLDSVLNSSDKDEIPIEKINGPVLLISPEYDPMWPSEIASKKITERLEKKNFKFPFHLLSYKYVSHILVPLNLSMSKAFLIERKYPDQCFVNKKDSFEKTIKFLEEKW